MFPGHMRLFVSALLLAGLCIPMAHAQQSPASFPLKLENATVLDALRRINELSGNEVIYKKEDVETETKRVNIDLRSVTAREAVTLALENTRLDCIERDGSIVVVRKNTVIVRGRVSNQNSMPLYGATISYRNAAGVLTGVAADAAGNFMFEAPGNLSTMTVSYVGHAASEVRIDGREFYDITLEEQSIDIGEVVVTGIFTRKAESFTGATATFNQQQLKLVGNSNIFQSLKNLDPSLNIADNLEMGSDPNTIPSMQLRGTSTFPRVSDGELDLRGQFESDPNRPLFILDGFEVSAETVFDLDMDRVQTVTILKDAASKAIYGSKAANGVIVIETVGVVRDGVRVTYNGKIDVSMPDLTSYELTNALEKLEAEMYDGTIYPNTVEGIARYNQLRKRALEGLDEYWLSKPVRTGIGQRHSLSFDMGTSAMKTTVNVSYNDVKGVMKGSDRQTISGGANMVYRTAKLALRNQTSISYNVGKNSPYGSFSQYVQANPYSPAYGADGKPLRYTDAGMDERVFSPLYTVSTATKNQTQYLGVISNTYLEWTIVEGLRATARFGVDTKRTGADRYLPFNHNSQTDVEPHYARGQYTLNNGTATSLTGEVFMTYARVFGDHSVFANGGWDVRQERSNEVVNMAQGYRSEQMDEFMFGYMYPEGGSPGGAATIRRSIGLRAVAGYNYRERYLLDATLRMNGGSMFGARNRWGTFWSLGVGWNLHRENFIADNLPFIENLKLRATTGYSGNQNFWTNSAVVPYQYYTDESYYLNWYGSYLRGMENPDLQWEQKHDINLGLDLTIKGISLTFDAYRADTEHLITQITIPGSTGFKTVNENLGLVRNQGLEARLSVPVIRRGDLTLSLLGSIAWNHNEILELSDAMKQYNETLRSTYGGPEGGERTTTVVMYEEGGNMNTIWAVKSYGIDPSDGYELYRTVPNEDGYSYLTKVWRAVDMVPSGISVPKYRGNFSVSGEYRNLGWNLNFNFLGGGQLYNTTLLNKVENANLRYNVDRRVLTGRWKEPGDNVQFRRIVTHYAHPISGVPVDHTTRPTSRFVQDNNELSLSAASVYYDLKSRWVMQYGLERLKVQANMNDVFRWSTIGIERGTSYPFARTVSLSITAIF